MLKLNRLITLLRGWGGGRKSDARAQPSIYQTPPNSTPMAPKPPPAQSVEPDDTPIAAQAARHDGPHERPNTGPLPPLIYSQSSGQLWLNNQKLSVGYSGAMSHKNAPASQSIPYLGPIPRGLWRIRPAFHSDKLGPVTLPVDALYHDAKGRTNFAIHGDSIANPGRASQGCIILNRSTREAIDSFRHTNGEAYLLVVE